MIPEPPTEGMDMQKAAEVRPEELRVKNVKVLRVGLDSMLQGLHRLQADQGSREVALAVTKTQEAIMWLGMELKRMGKILGTTSPYPDGYKPENAIVNPVADGLKL